jgi:two-component system sensor histidine kinase/response regulator
MSEERQFTASDLKVLLVDDDDSIHQTIELFLANTEYRLISARSVKEAMAFVASINPDIVITDAMMPGESGFCLIEKLKSEPETANIPIILGTILQESNGGVMDASHKADISINKPFYRRDIIGSLEKAKKMIDSSQAVAGVTIKFS